MKLLQWQYRIVTKRGSSSYWTEQRLLLCPIWLSLKRYSHSGNDHYSLEDARACICKVKLERDTLRKTVVDTLD